jgi:threonyl-tRNA synthetase
MKKKIKDQNYLRALRHSCEHVLTQAMLNLYGNDLKFAMGPATDEGFYFDFDYPQKIAEEDFPKIEKEMKKIIKKNLPFKKEVISIKKARELFKDNPYKQEWLDEIEKKGEKATVYWTGDKFVDLCSGPHVRNTGEIKAFKLLSVAGAYWRGDEKNKMLTRIYGTAFPNQKELKVYLRQLEEAKKRDHRKLGPRLGLFFFDQTAPGMPYWLPKGTIIYNELLKFWREEHQKRGYQETITPLLNKKDLYEASGHWQHYKKFMFISKTRDGQIYALKPMNCPNAMMIFKSQKRSYKELPLRLSDCDSLHRQEKSGELNGLLRVQKFAQDDAHIFITGEQIKSEYKSILDIAKRFYSIFNIDFKIRLGTRPKEFMGDKKTWDKAESDLENILKESKTDYSIGEGEGAFYGPKLDIMMTDCMGREWQTGTIQLDFQIPRRFKLTYVDQNNKEKTPVVIHRVIYGSLERFIGILIEHFAGAFPVWLAPVQVRVLPITEKQIAYGKKVTRELQEEKIRADIDDSNQTLSYRIRQAQMEKIPFVLVVGEREEREKTVAIRQRDGQNLGGKSLAWFLKKIKGIIENKSLKLIN